jgi:carboxyl-terminal processing protease
VLAQTSLPAPVAADVNESYRLLTHTYYKPVDQQSLVDAARKALVAEAARHRARVSFAPIAPSASADATLASLDADIASAAQTSHATPTEFAYAAISGMANSVGDKYTVFMDPDQYRQFNEALDPQKISGIGVLIAADKKTGNVSINYVVPGTPADRAGLQAGDVLASADGKSMKGLTVQEASKLLRGAAGSTVHLAIQRGTQALDDVAIVRSEIQPPTVIGKMLPGNIAYVYVLAFGKDTPDEFDTALARLHGARAYVLDLRNDGGGYVDSALDMASHFVSRMPLLTVEQRGVPDQTIDAERTRPLDAPVTILVNRYTASASEIMAGALQDDGVAALVGEKTFGKGVMQTLTPLQDGAAIKITTAHYLTPRHRDINLKGIEPDVAVQEPSNARFGDVSNDPQLRAAMAFLQKKIAAANRP